MGERGLEFIVDFKLGNMLIVLDCCGGIFFMILECVKKKIVFKGRRNCYFVMFYC